MEGNRKMIYGYIIAGLIIGSLFCLILEHLERKDIEK